MTNEEAIEILRNGFTFNSNSGFINGYNALIKAINSLEENTKLKAENKKLQERLEIKDKNFELYSDALDEIEQLKAELQQSVKLPCKVGDVVYIVRNCTAPSCEICRGYLWLNNCIKEYSARIFESNFKINMFDLIGKSVFLSREEAEQSLKCKVEE